MSKYKLVIAIVTVGALFILITTCAINANDNTPPDGWKDEALWNKINPILKSEYKRSWSNMTPECKNRIMQEADDKINKRDNDNYRTDFTPKELQDKAERLSVRTYGKHFSQLTN